MNLPQPRETASLQCTEEKQTESAQSKPHHSLESQQMALPWTFDTRPVPTSNQILSKMKHNALLTLRFRIKL